MAKQLFQIVRFEATYCEIRGGVNGSRAVHLPMAYMNEALAKKLAQRIGDAEYWGGSDDYYKVIPYGRNARGHWDGHEWRDQPSAMPWISNGADDLPF
jgi:hypothetical protein